MKLLNIIRFLDVVFVPDPVLDGLKIAGALVLFAIPVVVAILIIRHIKKRK